MAMDGRIVGVTENLTRSLFHLNPAYETTKCTANNKNVSIEMSNGIIPITAKYPRLLIDDILQGEQLPDDVIAKCTAMGARAEDFSRDEEQEEEEEESDNNGEELEENNEEEEETPQEPKTKKSKVIRRKKK